MNTLQRFRVELRSSISADGRYLVGHAAVFDQIADLGPQGLESVASTAFTRALAKDTTDARALINHDPNMLLGRQSAGTLSVEADKHGLAYEIDLPDTTYANNLRTLVKRGDLTGGSFGVIPGKISRSTHDGRMLRTHTDFEDLVDISVVTFPAYEGTDTALRSYVPRAGHSNRSRLVRARAAVTLNQRRIRR